ncbi:YwiC-like family protein [Nocardioides sp. T2.26MG-1]|uniref:YwiC-like family protein n=1 Tax=Nocardioides sp. T2.26MG-1 TaxID=3041166 RepID=UPI002477C42C|nr:YwiC-like family protein [Nocardioides sp. T2.26MG-1]CAI9417623.1 hypothetical protein HIDPHFAB_03066 [Nocardioides sp. T2.26MG-1]
MTAAAPPPARAVQRTSLVPPQHGAWAFLGLPLALGFLVADPAWTWLPLAWAWVAAYPASYFLLSYVRARRPERFRRPLAIWVAVFAPAGLAAVALRPWLLWVAAVYLASFAVNLAYARRNRERDLVNDAVFVAQCSVMVVVTALVGDDPDTWSPGALLGAVSAHAWLLSGVCAMVLLGSTLHVKSLLRERRDPRYASASRWYAVACLVASPALALAWGLPEGWAFVVPFALLAGRALRRDWSGMRPGAIGMVELAGFIVVLAAGAVAVAAG